MIKGNFSIKKFLGILLAAVLCLGFAACGEKQAPNVIDDMVKEYDDTTDYSDFLGAWTSEEAGYLEANLAEENSVIFEIYLGDNQAASAYMQYVEKYGYVYAYNDLDGKGYRCSFDENGALTVESFGTFTKLDETDEY